MTGNPFRLENQWALVTGGGSGLGLATCQALVEAGAQVILTGRRVEPLQEACAQLGPAAHYLRHDVTDLASTPVLIEQIEQQYGPLDILVNNAGIISKKPAIETKDVELAQIMQTHLFGSFALSRECGRRMLERQRGSIIMILSMAALFGIPQISPYTAAKSSLLGLTRALAVELSPHGVRVNAVAPGWIETDMTRRAFESDPARKAKALSRTPLGRMGEPLDIGYAIVYLCSPAAKFVTGVVLPVDGGASIGF
ncbi:MAG: 3-oxoacyl-ACP reductase [Chloroflexota bacterium]|nr:MAG: 3-oxoacyl-ACP reductase [Chloroflexota bacterium]